MEWHSYAVSGLISLVYQHLKKVGLVLLVLQIGLLNPEYFNS